MSRRLLILYHDDMRKRAVKLIMEAPSESRVTFEEPKRTLKQNARQWFLLSLISENCVWHGAKWGTDAWHDYFCHALHGERWMPYEDGGMIPIGRSTSTLSIKDHADLTMLMEAFCARRGIEIPEIHERMPARQGHAGHKRERPCQPTSDQPGGPKCRYSTPPGT